MDLKECRKNIDRIDDDMVRLFVERMEVASEVAAYKREHGLPVLDQNRERDVIRAVREKAPPHLAGHVANLFQNIMSMSRYIQHTADAPRGKLVPMIRAALEETPKLFPQEAVVACQGVEGAYSQIACQKLFRYPKIDFAPSFEGVFQAVENGACRYGVLPIENSSYGSVSDVYDLLKRYRAYIVRGLRLRIAHSLLAKPGVELSDVREVFSHRQALGQCGRFLRGHGGIKAIECANTAVAAKTVAESERRDIAAISSRECAQLYGLSVLSSSVSDSDGNYTRFIVISKTLEIYPGASRLTMMTELSHRPGSLALLLARFASLGLDLTKIESRPIPGSDFEFKFYFDLDASVYSEDVLSMLAALEAEPEPFEFLGSYTEI